MVRRAAPGAQCSAATAPPTTLDFGAEPHDVELGANPDWDATTLRVAYQSLTTPAVGLRPRPRSRGERTLRKQTPTPGVDLDPLRRDPHLGHGARRHAGPRRRRAPRRHTDRRHGAVRALRLRLLRGVDAAVVQRRPPLAARPGLHVGARPPARRRRARPVVVPRRQAAQQAQHVRRHARRRRPSRRAGLRRRRAPSPSAGGSAGGLLVGACITMRPERFAAAIAEVPVRRRRHHDERPDAAAHRSPSGTSGAIPASEPFASYMLSYSPYDNTMAGDPSQWPAIYVTAGLNDPRVELPRAGQVGGQAAFGRRRHRPPARAAHRDGRRSRRPERPLRGLAGRGPHAERSLLTTV